MSVLDFVKAHWQKLALVGVVLLAFAAGRYATPSKVQTKTVERVEYRDRVVTQTVQVQAEAKERIVYRDRTITRKADGTVIQNDIERDDTSDKTQESTEESTTHETERTEFKASSKTVERDAPRLHVGVLAGVDILHLARPQLLGPLQLGGQVEYRIVGPLWVGGWGLSSGVAGASLGLTF